MCKVYSIAYVLQINNKKEIMINTKLLMCIVLCISNKIVTVEQGASLVYLKAALDHAEQELHKSKTENLQCTNPLVEQREKAFKKAYDAYQKALKEQA